MTGRYLDPSSRSNAAATAAECPYCGSRETERDHPRGPSLCRSMHFCYNCGQPFEKFE